MTLFRIIWNKMVVLVLVLVLVLPSVVGINIRIVLRHDNANLAQNVMNVIDVATIMETLLV